MRAALQITRDCPYLSAHENLIEALLEMKNYADVQQVLSKYDGKKRLQASAVLLVVKI